MGLVFKKDDKPTEQTIASRDSPTPIPHMSFAKSRTVTGEAAATGIDGRSYADFTSAVVNQDGSTDKVTDRAYNASVKLTMSGNYTYTQSGGSS